MINEMRNLQKVLVFLAWNIFQINFMNMNCSDKASRMHWT